VTEKETTVNDVRDLLTDEVRKAYRETDEECRALLCADLRKTARENRITKDFDTVFKAFEKSVRDEEKAAADRDMEEKRSARSAENKINFKCLKNPFPGLHSYTYAIDDNGVYLNGNRICSQPVLIFGKFQNIETSEESFCITYFGSGQWQRKTVKREILFNASKVIQMAAYGLSVHSANARDFVKFLDTFEQENPTAMSPKLSVSRLGWFGADRFAPYEASLVFDGEGENKDLYDCVSEAGSFEDWVSQIRELRKNINLRLTMAAGFASPLIDRIHALPFIFHLWGGSGVGKTVALMVAMSVWGDPSAGKLLRTLNATKNSMLNTAAFFHSLPVAYDELQIIKLQFSSLDALIMTLTEGIDRGRMKYDEAQRARPWKCCFLFSGEEPCTKAGSGGGVFNRVIEVECIAPVVANGNQVVNFIRANYGHAGRVFIDYIKRKDIPALFNEKNSSILHEIETTDKQAASMALMMVADKLATECLFPGEVPLNIEDVRPFLKIEREVDVAARAYEYICGIIAANASKFDTNPRLNVETWGKVSDGVCTFNKVKLEEQMQAGGFSFDAVKRAWAENEHLLKTPQGRLVHNASYGGIKASSVKLIVQDDDYEQIDDDLPL
jgi:Superfamily II helicase and inactivated derivatives